MPRPRRASVEAVNGSLYLAALLPDRKDPSRAERRQRIPLRLVDDKANRKKAERDRIELQRQLDQGTFRWADWRDEASPGERVRAVSFRAVGRELREVRLKDARLSPEGWDLRWQPILETCGLDCPCTTQALEKLLSGYDPCQGHYGHVYRVARAISKQAGIPFPESASRPRYELQRQQSVPSDETIERWVLGSEDRRWYFALIATYGLRPHETHEAELMDNGDLYVPDDSKTGYRLVVPLHARWVEAFGVKAVERTYQKPCKGQAERRAFSEWLRVKTRMLQRQGLLLPHRTYDLRHAYAARLWTVGEGRMDVVLASQLMGHSVDIHTRTYQRWVDRTTIANRARSILGSS